MSTLLDEPSKRAPLAPEKDEPNRSIGIGVACTVVFHVLLIWLSPKFNFAEFTGSHGGIAVNSVNNEKTFDFQLVPPEPTEEKKPPMRFVETNTAAPENTPDKTNNFSNRDQQSAQEEAAKEKDPDNMPSVKGQDEIKNDSAIVSGDMAPPQIGAPPTPETAEQNDVQREQEAQKARAEQVPLQGFEKAEGLSNDGVASSIFRPTDKASTNADQLQEGAKDSKETEGGLIAMDASKSSTQPKPRPRLSSTSLNRSTILTNRASGTSNIGIQASDAFRSEYGEYLQELTEIVQTQWYHVIDRSQLRLGGGVKVAIRFKINSEGEVEILNIEETAGKQGTLACSSAIQERQPYRKWTQKMIDLLGTSQELEFTFHYL